MQDYLTVNDGEKFSYGSVWYNQSKDVHPPLYYAILHTVCSLFPDTYSKWFGYIVNMLAFVVTQIFLFKLSKNIVKSDFLALCTVALYGFSIGAMGVYVYIRMYALLTMWGVIFTYITSYAYIYIWKVQEKVFSSSVDSYHVRSVNPLLLFNIRLYLNVPVMRIPCI